MRLINVETLALEEFYDDAIPKYGILSHTWGEGEVKYEEMLQPDEEVMSRQGYQKIKRCAAYVKLQYWLMYVWVDTCCIDKRSSTELSEAINSMYVWYKKAEICIAYLADIPHEDMTNISGSRWFTRGWTLQELVAPREVIFVNSQWIRFGIKRDGPLVLSDALILSDITSIPPEVLQRGLHEKISVADKMSWVSSRQTTRREDIAYCLLGLFDVNMPLLYGEGDKAFIRLQEEIIKRSDDHSIFAWCDTGSHYSSYHGLLADSPSFFQNAGGLAVKDAFEGIPYSFSNVGLQISFPLIPLDKTSAARLKPPFTFVPEKDLFVALLNLTSLHLSSRTTVAIILKRLETGKNHFARVLFRQTVSYDSNNDIPGKIALRKIPELIYVRQNVRIPSCHVSPRFYGVQIMRMGYMTGMPVLENIRGETWHEMDPIFDVYRMAEGSTMVFATVEFNPVWVDRERKLETPLYVVFGLRPETRSLVYGISTTRISAKKKQSALQDADAMGVPGRFFRFPGSTQSVAVAEESRLERGMLVVVLCIRIYEWQLAPCQGARAVA